MATFERFIAASSSRPVHDSYRCSRPEGDADEQGPIVQQRVGRVAATLPLMNEIEISEYAVERKRHGENQMFGPELLNRFGTDRIERVREQRGRGDDSDHLIEKVRAVFRET